MKIKIKTYLYWIGIGCTIVFILSIFLYMLFFNHKIITRKDVLLDHNNYCFARIVTHNLAHYIITVLCFPLSLLTIAHNWLILTFSIAVGAELFGWKSALLFLFPHGFIEIPNILTYQYLSYKMMIILFKKRDFKEVIYFIQENKWWFIGSLFFVIVSALIEGYK